MLPEKKEVEVCKEYKGYSKSKSDDGFPQYEGDVADEVPGEHFIWSIMEYRRKAPVHATEFEKTKCFGSSCLKHINTVIQMSKEDSEKEKTGDTGKSQIKGPSKHLYFSTMAKACPEALAEKSFNKDELDLTNYSAMEQCLVCEGSISAHDNGDKVNPFLRQQSDESDENYTLATSNSTIPFAEVTCDAIQEICTDYSMAD